MATRKKPLIVGNWKMYVGSLREAKDLARTIRRKSRLFSSIEVAVAPTFPFIPGVVEALKGSSIHVGAQTLSAFTSDAHTGDVSAAILKSTGISFAIIGHSERRAAGETYEVVRLQLQAAEGAGLRSILCVGETERDASGSYFEIIALQLKEALSGFPKTSSAKLVIAYEPVWAIGKSAAEAMKPSDLRETTIFIRKTLAEILGREAGIRVPILYGGSVEAENAQMLLQDGDVSGFLVGRASAHPDAFIELLKVCKK